MRYLLRVISMFVDSWLAWFTPLWRRRGHEACSLITRYMRHYRPTIPAERLAALAEVRGRLQEAMCYWRKDEVVELTRRVEEDFAGRMPGFRRNAWVEMVESLFVITVVFLGIRTYYVQPFRIPTNSMWPSLNGIVVHPVEQFPSLPVRVWHTLTLGSSYVDITADKPKTITHIADYREWVLFTKTVITFDDGSSVSIPAASGTVVQYLREQGKLRDTPLGSVYMPYAAGETIMRARVDAGDMVLVNRMAYHFRHPRRGETFVFDTRGINTASSPGMREQSGGTHFIKRLCGVPGDTISISSPDLVVNGARATEPGILRVEECRPPYRTPGYYGLSPLHHPMAYLKRGSSIMLDASSPERPWMREYLALGDNTTNSLDSRYWGPVRQFNVLGPACLTLWPFTQHWGAID